MNETDKQRIIARYNKRLEQFGATIEALASGNENRRAMRFNTLLEAGVQPGDHILDLGCGFGDLYAFTQQLGLDIKYTGIDINPNLVAEAQQRFPGVDFRTADIQHDAIGQFDFVLSTSCFNLKMQHQDNYTFAGDILQAAYKCARKGVAIDFLTSYVDFKGNAEEAFYYEPEKMFPVAKAITRRVTLRHDYPLFEFCLYLYPDFEGWHNKA